MERIKKYLFEIFLIAPAFTYLLGFLIIVVVYLLKMSFTAMGKHYQEIFPTMASWRMVFQNPDFASAFWHTLGFVIVGTPLELGAGLVLALLVYRSFWGRNLVQSIFTLPLAIPALVTAILLFILFDYPGGHVNNIITGKHFFFPALIGHPVNFRSNAVFALGVSLLGKVWRDMPISMLILLSGLNSIDHEQQEAAVTMGASAWQRNIQKPHRTPSLPTSWPVGSPTARTKPMSARFLASCRYARISSAIWGTYLSMDGWVIYLPNRPNSCKSMN